MPAHLERARSLVREIPDYPQPGIRFLDLTPVLADAAASAAVTDALSEYAQECDIIAGIEARGFIFAAALAQATNKGFIPIRKAGKLPYLTYGESYGLEYGHDTLEIHQDAVRSGARTLIVDDVLATGGTACAAIRLVQRSGGIVTSVVTVLELPPLGGKARIANENADLAVHSLFSL